MLSKPRQQLWLTWCKTQGWILWKHQPVWEGSKGKQVGVWDAIAGAFIWHYCKDLPPGWTKTPKKPCCYEVTLPPVMP